LRRITATSFELRNFIEGRPAFYLGYITAANDTPVNCLHQEIIEIKLSINANAGQFCWLHEKGRFIFTVPLNSLSWKPTSKPIFWMPAEEAMPPML
jgi:hypothetical protein